MNHFKELLLRSIEENLAHVLPRKVKRLIFIVSLVGILENINDPKAAVLKRINEIFQLVDDSKALKLPIYFKSYIWRDLSKNVDVVFQPPAPTDTLIYGESAKAFIDKILDSCPSWLVYGSRDMQENDIRRILLHRCIVVR